MAYSIRISLSSRMLFLTQDGRQIKAYPVGVGRPGHETPVGSYSIAVKRPHPGGPFGVMWLGLSVPGYGIHGTNNPSSIGGYVSHGCIRMYNQDVLELAITVNVGTPVYISA
jgi:Uncharacterized protein conserved in bacteria